MSQTTVLSLGLDSLLSEALTLATMRIPVASAGGLTKSCSSDVRPQASALAQAGDGLVHDVAVPVIGEQHATQRRAHR